MKKELSKNLNALIDAVLMIVGGALYALGFSVFIEPNQISPGGVTGIAALVHYLIGAVPTGVLALIFNIPLLIAGLLVFGKNFIIKTGCATVTASILIDVFKLYIPYYAGDKILASLAGGVMIGVGLAVVIVRGATTGGTDIAAKLINRKFPSLSMGKSILILDVSILIAATIVYRNLETSLYSILALFTSSKVIDGILYGADRGKLIYIITKKPDELSEKIINIVGRGVSRMKVIGGYTQTERTMLMCATRRQEAAKLHAIITQADSEAFVIVSDVGEIRGEGFKKSDQ
ncbi:MAG: YitT family protein [Oscillospiraceae bacterium]